MEGNAMSLNKLKRLICIFAVIFLCDITMGKTTFDDNTMQIKQKEKSIYAFLQSFFMHCVDEIPFEEKWTPVWGKEVERFFVEKIPSEFQKYDKDISFAGEFIRFQFDNFLKRYQEKYSIDMYILPRKSATYNFVKKQFAMIDIPLENRILECFIRFKIMNFDNKNRGIVPLNFYIGIALLDSDVIRLEYCEFLTNSKLALNGKIPGLENISQADLVQYAKWLLSQKCKYDNIHNHIPR